MPDLDLTQPLIAYRLCKTIHADLSGMGVARYPSRWNRHGQRAIYTASSRALALNEVLVHLPKGSQPRGYSLVTITIQPAELVLRRSLRLAQKWFDFFGHALTEDGDDPIGFIAPSVNVPDYNIVLYLRPERFEPHPVRISSVEPFEFDPRLFIDALTTA